MFRSPDEIREAYRDERTAQEYVGQRFREPLGALLHDRQVAAVRRLLAAGTIRHALELAPGPARLTVDVAPSSKVRGTLMDASLQMLAEARRRLQQVGVADWRLIQGDAFQLPFRERFDLVYSFRLIRHFADADRGRLYRELHRVMSPGGLLVFDAINETVSAPLRQQNPHEYRHYDALLRPEGLRRELGDAGFEVVALDGVQHRYGTLHRLQTLVAPRSRRFARLLMEAVERTGGEPLEWIVTCRRT
jgi:ubiquinone/menaquinone biosynthesis C-methylase UbiE